MNKNTYEVVQDFLSVVYSHIIEQTMPCSQLFEKMALGPKLWKKVSAEKKLVGIVFLGVHTDGNSSRIEMLMLLLLLLSLLFFFFAVFFLGQWTGHRFRFFLGRQ